MALQYRTTALLTKPTGAAVSLAVPFPSRCDLRSVVVRQENPDGVSGTDAFTVDVFDQDPAGFTPANPEETHKVLATQTGATGIMQHFVEFGWAFINKDAIPATRVSLLKLIYVRVSGAGTNKFRVALSASLPLD